MQTQQMWDVIIEQRIIIAGFLHHLSDEQWLVPSLCAGWRVQEVAAHLISAPQLTMPVMMRLMPSLLRYGYDGMVLRDGLKRAARGRAAIEEEFNQFARVPKGPALVGVKETLTDTLVHAQDMLRPLGLEHPMPRQAAVEVARRLSITGVMLASRRINNSVSMQAADAEFAAGTGPLLTGPIDELVMLRAGRAPRWELLSGPGVETVRRVVSSR